MLLKKKESVTKDLLQVQNKIILNSGVKKEALKKFIITRNSAKFQSLIKYLIHLRFNAENILKNCFLKNYKRTSFIWRSLTSIFKMYLMFWAERRGLPFLDFVWNYDHLKFVVGWKPKLRCWYKVWYLGKAKQLATIFQNSFEFKAAKISHSQSHALDQ